jgi:general secretion pathway protein F
MIKNTYFKTKIQEVVLHIKNGIPLGEAFEMSHLLSNKTIRLFYISKYGDNLQLILENMVKMLEQDYITKIDKFSNSIGPILIFFLGGIVLFMVIAILSPIWDMGSVLG